MMEAILEAQVDASRLAEVKEVLQAEGSIVMFVAA